MNAGAIEIAEQACRFPVPTEAIPDYQEWALEVPMELLDKAKDIIAREIPLGDGKIEAQALAHGRDGDRAGDGEAVVTLPTIMNGGVPLGCPRAAHRGLEHEATLIDEDYGAVLTPGFF